MDLYYPDSPIGPKARFHVLLRAFILSLPRRTKSLSFPAEYIVLYQNSKKLPQSMRQPLILFLLVNLRSGIKKVSRMLCTAGLSLTPSLCQINCKQAEKGFILSKPRRQISPGYIAIKSCQIPTDLARFCAYFEELGILGAMSIVIPKIPWANWVFRAGKGPYTQAPLSQATPASSPASRGAKGHADKPLYNAKKGCEAPQKLFTALYHYLKIIVPCNACLDTWPEPPGLLSPHSGI